MGHIQLRKNLFETPYARTLLAVAGTVDAPGDTIAFALYFHNFSTWTGKPGIYVRAPGSGSPPARSKAYVDFGWNTSWKICT